jgi:hypothetical protein
MTRILASLGVVLLLGGLGHAAGVIQLYVTGGVPDANRVLLDVWIGEAQLMSGGFYLATARASRAGSSWHALGVAGALTVAAFAVPMLPVLVARAPLVFRVPPIVYLAWSLFILVRAVRPG